MRKILNLILVVVLVLAVLPVVVQNQTADAGGPNAKVDGKYYDVLLTTSFVPTDTFVQTRQTGVYSVKSGKVSLEYESSITASPVMANKLPINCNWIGGNGVYVSGNNFYSVVVNGTAMTSTVTITATAD